MAPYAEADQALKAYCCGVYQSRWARLLLGDSLHPGGPQLTERAGTLLRLDATCTLIDVASGRGASAAFLARRYGCRVVGVDYGADNTQRAAALSAIAGAPGRVQFLVGDAEALPLRSGSCDAVLCECSLCLLPNKAQAVGEWARALRTGGRLVVADVVRNGPVPPELAMALGWAACVGAACPAEEYTALLEAGGLAVTLVEEHPAAVQALARQVQGRLLMAEAWARLGQLPWARDVDWAKASRLAAAAVRAAQDRRLSYAVIAAVKPLA